MNYWLIIGGAFSALAAVLHIAIIIGGPSWYRFFHAGEAMAEMAERKMAKPALITAGIAALLAVASLYAFSGAGLIGRLPLLQWVLMVIAAIYILRGFSLLPLYALMPVMVDRFMIWSAAITLVFGLCYAIGTWILFPHFPQFPLPAFLLKH